MSSTALEIVVSSYEIAEEMTFAIGKKPRWSAILVANNDEEAHTLGDPLLDADAKRQRALDELVNSLANKGSQLLAQSSGDPLLDADAQRQRALDELVNSLANKGSKLLAQSSGDPLLDADAQRQRELDDLVNSLANKDSKLLAQSSGDPLLDADAKRQRELDDLVNSLVNKDTKLIAQENNQLDAQEIEKQLEALNDFMALGQNEKAATNAGAIIAAPAELLADRQRRVMADETLEIPSNAVLMATESKATSATDVSSVIGGAALLLVAVIALFAAATRRRKQTKTDKDIDLGYQLFV